MAKQEKHLLQVIKGGLVPADNYTTGRLKDKGYKIGDYIHAVLTKARNPKFHRLVHKFGEIVAENIPSFEEMEAHKVLKRIQLEGKIECEEVGFYLEGHGILMQLIPRSLSFSSMDEGVFNEVFKKMCRHISKTYWSDRTDEQIANMAQFMVDE